MFIRIRDNQCARKTELITWQDYIVTFELAGFGECGGVPAARTSYAIAGEQYDLPPRKISGPQIDRHRATITRGQIFQQFDAGPTVGAQ